MALKVHNDLSVSRAYFDTASSAFLYTSRSLGRIRTKPGYPALIPGKEGYFYKLHYGDTGLASKFDINRNEAWDRNRNREKTEEILMTCEK